MIGRGGQGVVLKVRHLEWNQELALKLPLPQILNSPISHERFLREAQTWIELGLHPHIVRCWFVKPVIKLPGLFLDFVSQGSLEIWLKNRKKGELRTRTVVRMMLEAAEGLAHSHGLGVVHRDVKPANLLLDEHGRIQVTDFGLVKTSENQVDRVEPGAAEAPFDAGITRTGEFVGTPSYGAPEQWMGEKVGPTADIYSLGIVFYEMLCGRRPFDEPKSRAELGALIVNHLNTPPPDPREFNPKVPTKLAKLTLQCLQKRAVDRPPSMRAVIGALEPIFNHLSTQNYRGPAPVSEGERPDLLNNAAVSLYSLGQTETATKLLARGLRKEAGHAECLYNLVQLERRSGQADGPESLRRLRRANLKYPLAALCVEEGLPQKALEILASVAPDDRNGITYRTCGDALMYMRRYGDAVEAYQEAESRMPGDKPTRERLEYARSGTVSLHGRNLFPSPVPSSQGKVEPATLLKISHNSLALLGATGAVVFCRNIDSKKILSNATRPPGACQPIRSWLGPERFLTQDQNRFEIWSVPDLSLVANTEGRVLAHSPDLSRLLIQRDSELRYVDLESGDRAKLVWSETEPVPERVHATYEQEEEEFHLLTQDGRLAFVGRDHTLIPNPVRGLSNLPPIAIFSINSRDELASVSEDGLLQVRSLSSGAVLYAHRLPFVPTTLCSNVDSTRLLLSSSTHCAVLDESGTFLFQSLGPLALNTERTRFLAWQGGRLSLFELNPFRRLRSWTKRLAQPLAVDLARDGRRAVTLGAKGDYQIWEVDEDSRVYARSLLLTSGQTYDQLVNGYEQFDNLFREANELVTRSQFWESYQSLQEARAVNGFHQAESALALQWVLVPKLRRERLEAIWERLTTERVRFSCISADSELLALAHDDGLTLWRNAGSKTSLIRSVRTSRRFLGLYFMDAGAEGPLLIYVDVEGKGECLRVSDGALVGRIDCQCGKLHQVKFLDWSLFFVSKSNQVGVYDLTKGKVTASNTEVRSPIRELFPIRDQQALLLTGKGPEMLHFRKRGALLNLTPDLQRQITFLDAYAERNLFLLGLSTGQVMVSDERTGNIVFSCDLKAGPVTGFKIIPSLSVGVAVSSKGKLTLCDLSEGKILEQFTAHSASIVDLQISTEGRYLATITDTGQSRLWETSWLLEDGDGPPPLRWFRLKRRGRFYNVR